MTNVQLSKNAPLEEFSNLVPVPHCTHTNACLSDKANHKLGGKQHILTLHCSYE